MKQVIGCLLSAIFGSLFSVWMLQPSTHGELKAHEQQVNHQQVNHGPVFPQGNPKPVPLPIAKPVPKPRAKLSPEEAINVAVYKRGNRSVVNITTQTVNNKFFLLEGVAEGAGSGCVLDNAGHILTNYHVVEGARRVGVTLYDGKTYTAKFIGADPINDLAIIKIQAPKKTLFPFQMGNSGQLQVGMKVFAIGNPFGLERTMTTGIISSLNRTLKIRANRTIRSIIQIDAAVNPGNSGGPLLNSRGELIGINTAIASRTGQNSGIGFAIPANLIARVVPQLLKHGRVIRPEIGIRRVYETEKGLLIAAINPNSSAAKAGLRGPKIIRKRRGVFTIEEIDRSAADLIIAIDGKPVKTADKFLGYIETKKPGDTVSLTIIRQGRQQIVNVPLTGGAKPVPRQPTPIRPR